MSRDGGRQQWIGENGLLKKKITNFMEQRPFLKLAVEPLDIKYTSFSTLCLSITLLI